MSAQPSDVGTGTRGTWHILLPLWALLLGGAACTDATIKPITWLQHPPREHRAVAELCSGAADGAVEAGASDAAIVGECNTDSDCASNKPCACARACGADGAVTNVCLAGSDCRVDSDCTGGAPFCSLSLAPAQECNAATGVFATGYFCHTTTDSCADDGDCTGTTKCLYHRAQRRWICG